MSSLRLKPKMADISDGSKAKLQGRSWWQSIVPEVVSAQPYQECLDVLRAAKRDIEALYKEAERKDRILRAILAADECGQGQPFAEAMEAAIREVGTDAG